MIDKNEKLVELSKVIEIRNSLEERVYELIKAPFEIGNIGEYIASMVFDIELNDSRSHPGYDGVFTTGSLMGKTVNVKFYSKHNNILDINEKYQPDYYLVLAGNKNQSLNKWSIDLVFLINNMALMKELNVRGVKIGTATSVVKSIWNQSKVYPSSNSEHLRLSEEQIKMIKMFQNHK